MKFNTLFFLLILSSVCLALAQVSFEDCCLKYVRYVSRGTQRHAVKYRRQERDGGCNIPAIVFTMRRGRVFCANPADSWVTKLMEIIDQRNKKQVHKRRG